MGGEQAATVLATITKDQRAREGKEVMTPVNHAVRRSAGESRGKSPFANLLPKS